MGIGGAVEFDVSAVLAGLYIVVAVLILIPLLVSWIWFKKDKKKSNGHVVVLLSFCAYAIGSLAVFSFNGFVQRFSDDNLIDSNETIANLLLGILILSTIGIFVGTAMVLANVFKRKRSSDKH